MLLTEKKKTPNQAKDANKLLLRNISERERESALSLRSTLQHRVFEFEELKGPLAMHAH